MVSSFLSCTSPILQENLQDETSSLIFSDEVSDRQVPDCCYTEIYSHRTDPSVGYSVFVRYFYFYRPNAQEYYLNIKFYNGIYLRAEENFIMPASNPNCLSNPQEIAVNPISYDFCSGNITAIATAGWVDIYGVEHVCSTSTYNFYAPGNPQFCQDE